MDVYLEMDADITIIDWYGQFANIHGCPQDVVEKMRARFVRAEDLKYKKPVTILKNKTVTLGSKMKGNRYETN